jgi:hypothetical protein
MEKCSKIRRTDIAMWLTGSQWSRIAFSALLLKQKIVSSAVLIFYDQGKITPGCVSKYLPGFANQRVLKHFNAADTTHTTVPVKRPVTSKDLLTLFRH